MRSVNRSLGGIGAGLGNLKSVLGPIAAIGGVAGLLAIDQQQSSALLTLFTGLTSDRGVLQKYLDLVNEISATWGRQPAEVAAVVANLGTSFGLLANDPDLELLTGALLALEAAGAGSAAALSLQLGPAIGNFDIGAVEALGVALLVSREHGIPLPNLLNTLINQSPKIANIFPTFEDAALAIGLFHREGVPAERAIIGFDTALRELTREEMVHLLDQFRLGLVPIETIIKYFGAEGGPAVAKLALSDSWPQLREAILGPSDAAADLRDNARGAIEELEALGKTEVSPFARIQQQLTQFALPIASYVGNTAGAISALLRGDFAEAGRLNEQALRDLTPDIIEDSPLGRFFFGSGTPGTVTRLPDAPRLSLDEQIARLQAANADGSGAVGVSPTASPLTQIIVEGSVVDTEGMADAVFTAQQRLAGTGRIVAFENAQ